MPEPHRRSTDVTFQCPSCCRSLQRHHRSPPLRGGRAGQGQPGSGTAPRGGPEGRVLAVPRPPGSPVAPRRPARPRRQVGCCPEVFPVAGQPSARVGGGVWVSGAASSQRPCYRGAQAPISWVLAAVPADWPARQPRLGLAVAEHVNTGCSSRRAPGGAGLPGIRAWGCRGCYSKAHLRHGSLGPQGSQEPSGSIKRGGAPGAAPGSIPRGTTVDECQARRGAPRVCVNGSSSVCSGALGVVHVKEAGCDARPCVGLLISQHVCVE